MSHPSLGLPRPADAGFPDAAARVRATRADLGARALEATIERDSTLRERLGEEGLRRLLRDTDIFLARIALAIESGDPQHVRGWTEWVVPVYRRRRVPLDDVITLAEGLRTALSGVLSADERVPADKAIDESVAVLRWHRRLGGDARDRGRLLNALYKGA